MKIAICGSIEIADKMKLIIEELEKKGYELEIPYYVKKIILGEVDLAEYKMTKEKEGGDANFRKVADEDLIKRHFENIKKCDAILVLNLEKNSIANYIGGNTFLEMGFAHVLNKKIFLMNGIPEIKNYKDEIVAMNPIILNGDLEGLK